MTIKPSDSVPITAQLIPTKICAGMICLCQIPQNEPPNTTSLSLWPSLCLPWRDRDFCNQDGKEKVWMSYCRDRTPT